MIIKYKDSNNKIKSIKLKPFRTGLYIEFPDGKTSASFKSEEEYSKELKEKLVKDGFTLIED